MSTTTFLHDSRTLTLNGHPARRCPDEILHRYERLLDEQRLRLAVLLHGGELATRAFPEAAWLAPE